MAKFKADRVNLEGLDNLAKMLKAKPPVGRIGVLGDKSFRSEKDKKKNGPTNAEIGAAHEFGSFSTGLPQRSWLRMPLIRMLKTYLEKSGAFNQEVTLQVLREKSMVPWLKKALVVAEVVVKDGFRTQGFGSWVPWKTKGYTNNTGQILQDTTQLRDSVTTDIKGQK